jgi:mannosyltransferase OCH1-like enzyme
MIPKIIHYCWFGRKKKPIIIKKCIESWKRLMPDFQVIEWNEDNTELNHPFVKKAYEEGKWAFVSDYIRLQKVFEFGGVYFDTDIVAVKSIENLLNRDFFIGLEDVDFINASVFGAIKNHFLVKKCLDEYDTIAFDIRKIESITIPKIITKALKKTDTFSHTLVDTTEANDVTIYNVNYFYPFPFSKHRNMELYKNYISEETYCVHLWFGSWLKLDEFIHIRRGDYLKALPLILKCNKKGNDTTWKYFIRVLREVRYSLKHKLKI